MAFPSLKRSFHVRGKLLACRIGFEGSRHFFHGYVDVRLVFICPILLLVFLGGYLESQKEFVSRDTFPNQRITQNTFLGNEKFIKSSESACAIMSPLEGSPRFLSLGEA